MLYPCQAAFEQHLLAFPASAAFDPWRKRMYWLRLTHVAADWAAGQGEHGDGVDGYLAWIVQGHAARVAGAGATMNDLTGTPITSSFCHCSNPTELASPGGAAALQKIMLMAVLGESTAPLWQDPIHQTVLENASIRTNIASAENAGPVANLSTLL